MVQESCLLPTGRQEGGVLGVGSCLLRGSYIISCINTHHGYDDVSSHKS